MGLTLSVWEGVLVILVLGRSREGGLSGYFVVVSGAMFILLSPPTVSLSMVIDHHDCSNPMLTYPHHKAQESKAQGSRAPKTCLHFYIIISCHFLSTCRSPLPTTSYSTPLPSEGGAHGANTTLNHLRHLDTWLSSSFQTSSPLCEMTHG